MAISFRIYPARQLVLVSFAGLAGIDETMRAADAYAADPDFRPDQKFLFDLSRVTDHERDFPRFFRMQARMAELYAQTGHDQLIGIFAPTRAAQDMAILSHRSWDGVRHLVSLIHPEEAEVLAFLGQPETSIAALRAVPITP